MHLDMNERSPCHGAHPHLKRRHTMPRAEVPKPQTTSCNDIPKRAFLENMVMFVDDITTRRAQCSEWH